MDGNTRVSEPVSQRARLLDATYRDLEAPLLEQGQKRRELRFHTTAGELRDDPENTDGS